MRFFTTSPPHYLTTILFFSLASFAEAQYIGRPQPLTPAAPMVIQPYPFAPAQAARPNPSLVGPGPESVQRYTAGGFGFWPGFRSDSPMVQLNYPRQMLPPPIAYVPTPFNTAQVSLQVPPGAKVWVQGERYDPIVGKRVFESPPLHLGENFIFEIRVTWVENGKLVEQKDRLQLIAGERRGLLYIATPEDAKSKAAPKPTGGES